MEQVFPEFLVLRLRKGCKHFLNIVKDAHCYVNRRLVMHTSSYKNQEIVNNNTQFCPPLNCYNFYLNE